MVMSGLGSTASAASTHLFNTNKGVSMNTLEDRWRGVEPLKCPRCKQMKLHPEQVLNALSRRDNETYICSPCGTDEAMIDWAASTQIVRDREWLKEEA